MPSFLSSTLRNYTEAILTSRHVPEHDAKWVASLLVKAHLNGHPSHGLGNLPWYVRDLDSGGTNPRPNIRLVKETPSMAMIDGDMGLGQIVAKAAIECAIEKVANQSVSVVSIRNSLHIGRLADFTDIGSQHGLITMMWVNVSKPQLAPHGGTEARLGTNPFAVSIPGNGGPFMSFDVASSQLSVGKLRHLHQLGEAIPEDILMDPQGEVCLDPSLLLEKKGGALRPFGEFRGFGHAILAEVLAGILSGSGLANDLQSPVLNGALIAVLKVADFIKMDEFFEATVQLKANLKATPPAPGSTGVRIPGERLQTEIENEKDPELDIPGPVWEKIEKLIPQT